MDLLREDVCQSNELGIDGLDPSDDLGTWCGFDVSLEDPENHAARADREMADGFGAEATGEQPVERTWHAAALDVTEDCQA